MCITPESEPGPRRLRDAAGYGFIALPGGTGTPMPGEPERVETPAGDVAYYLVPDRRDTGVVAVARILPDARVAAVVRPESPTPDCAAAVTGVATSAAQARAADVARRHGGTAVGEPRLVSDGVIGREAWLVVVGLPDGSTRWVFVTAGGDYARAAGQPPTGGIV